MMKIRPQMLLTSQTWTRCPTRLPPPLGPYCRLLVQRGNAQYGARTDNVAIYVRPTCDQSALQMHSGSYGLVLQGLLALGEVAGHVSRGATDEALRTLKTGHYSGSCDTEAEQYEPGSPRSLL